MDRTIAPEVNPIDSLTFLQPQKEIVNGMHLYFLSGLDIDVLKIEMVIKGGSVWQKRPLQASFTNKMLRKGTISYDAQKLAYKIDFNGSFIETSIDKDNASLTLYTTHDALNEMLPVLIEMYATSVFPPDELKKLQEIEKNNFLVNQEKVAYLATKHFQKALFQNHPYARLAEEYDFDILTVKDLKDFYETYYLNQNINIYVSGMVTDEIKNKIVQSFSVLELPSFDAYPQIDNITRSVKEEMKIGKPDALQAAIRLGKILPGRNHQDYVKLQFLSMVLGGYFGSRLMKNIREEKGFTYGIYSSYQSNLFASFFVIGTEVKNEVLPQALSEIYKEIDILTEEKIADDELNKVKTYILGKFLKSCDGAFEQMENFKLINEYNLPADFFQKYIEQINAISAEDIKQTAQKYFTDRSDWVEVTVADFK
jgi:predicted Zn-dependent peptidase